MESLEDDMINSAVLSGATRCLNSRRQGTSVIFPPERDIVWSNHILEAQRTHMRPKQLVTYNLELLKRAESLLQFFDANVGGSEEFPLQLTAENWETLDAFHDHLDRLRFAVGVLTEV